MQGIEPPALLDERGPPRFRQAFVAMAARAGSLDVAISRIRLPGLDLTPVEMGHLSRIRLLLRDVRAERLQAEAEALSLRRGGDGTLEFFFDLLDRRILEVRTAPLGGWSPDFTVFRAGGDPFASILGIHWLRRPASVQGPIFASLHGKQASLRCGRRFEVIWSGAHDVSMALKGLLTPRDQAT
jgi:hypothetical protein